ncbi:unnamed protein product [Peniophora sp. CBMAI 1063]|nr:unnamed protein product [Peniophora sp. CBMAI 1063]
MSLPIPSWHPPRIRRGLLQLAEPEVPSPSHSRSPSPTQAEPTVETTTVSKSTKASPQPPEGTRLSVPRHRIIARPPIIPFSDRRLGKDPTAVVDYWESVKVRYRPEAGDARIKCPVDVCNRAFVNLEITERHIDTLAAHYRARAAAGEDNSEDVLSWLHFELQEDPVFVSHRISKQKAASSAAFRCHRCGTAYSRGDALRRHLNSLQACKALKI